MKKIIASIFILGLSTFSFGQVMGISGTYGSEIKSLGINLRDYVFIGDKICLGPEVSLFPTHNVDGFDKSLLELNISGHYLFELTENIEFYPLTGLNYSVESVKIGNETEKEKEFGVNIGFGAHYRMGQFFPFAEYKYIVGGLSQQIISVGVLISIKM